MTEVITFRGDILDERLEVTLHEVCRICGTHKDTIVEMVREGIVEPSHPAEDEWIFSGTAVARIHVALRLQRDLGVNLPGAALALELLQEIERLRRRLG